MISEDRRELPRDCISYGRRHHTTPRLRNALQTSGNVDRRSEQVAAFIDYISEMNPNSDLQVSDFALLGERFLQSDGTTDGLQCSPELCQYTIAGCIRDPTSMLNYLVLRSLSDGTEGSNRPGFV